MFDYTKGNLAKDLEDLRALIIAVEGSIAHTKDTEASINFRHCDDIETVAGMIQLMKRIMKHRPMFHYDGKKVCMDII